MPVQIFFPGFSTQSAAYTERKYPYIGVDEAGRGCLAGPVLAAAVLLPEDLPACLDGLDDSKKLSPKKREKLAQGIRQHALAFGIGFSWPGEIDRINILNASFRAMSRACLALYRHGRAAPLAAKTLLASDPALYPRLCSIPLAVDGPQAIPQAQWRACAPLLVPPEQTPIIGGDALIPAIAAASILAKTRRDLLMVGLSRRFPGYGFERHKGYGTAAHFACLGQAGPCRLHRASFARKRAEERETALLLPGEAETLPPED